MKQFLGAYIRSSGNRQVILILESRDRTLGASAVISVYDTIKITQIFQALLENFNLFTLRPRAISV